MDAESVVFVVDEDATTGEAIQRLAAMMNLQCQCFVSGQVFLEAFDRAACGCVVAELKVPGLNGFQLQQRLLAEGCTLPVVFLTAHATVSIAVRAMRAGAFHFFEKPLHEQELWDAIQDAVAVDRERRHAMRHAETTRSQLAGLSTKETQVLRMLAEGKSNRMIAKELSLSIRTIEVRRNTLMKRLNLEAPDDLVQFAISAYGGANSKHGAHSSTAVRPPFAPHGLTLAYGVPRSDVPARSLR